MVWRGTEHFGAVSTFIGWSGATASAGTVPPRKSDSEVNAHLGNHGSILSSVSSIPGIRGSLRDSPRTPASRIGSNAHARLCPCRRGRSPGHDDDPGDRPRPDGPVPDLAPQGRLRRPDFLA